MTWLVMLAFVVFLFLLGAGFDAVYVGAGGGVLPIGSAMALAVGSVSAFASYYRGDRAVLASTRAQPVGDLMGVASDDDKLKLRRLENVVDEMAIASGVPRPPVYVVPDSDPNAFATGRGPGTSSLAVTRGLIDRLDREELQGVIAHEMSHIRNYDVRLMTIVAALVGAVALIADWAGRGMRWGPVRYRRGRSGNSGNGGGLTGVLFLAVWLVAIILAPIVARMLAMMVSREREYLADASGAELTRNPLGLARALEKIEGAVEPTPAIKQGSAHLCIADPLGRQAQLQSSFWSDLFASHPPMAKRIAALKAMAFQ